MVIKAAAPPIHSDTERTNVKLFAQTAPTFHTWRQRNDIEPTIKNSSVKSTCSRSKCCHRPKKTIISYLSNKYLWTKCLLVIKTNKTGTTACYLRRKKFLLNTVRLYQHIKTNNRSVFFGIVYQSANREEQYTLNQKKLLHTSAAARSAQNAVKRKTALCANQILRQ